MRKEHPLTLLRIHLNLPVHLARDRVQMYHSLGFFLPWLWRGRMVVSIHDIHPVIQREGTPQRLDGNTVVLEQQMAALSQTAIAYGAMARHVGYKSLRDIIQGAK